MTISDQQLPDSELEGQAEQNPAEQGVYSRSRCGGALRLARENQGLTTQEIASRLRLSTKQIEAIEADDFAKLPEATIVRGFIRNYAKQLKINAQPLLDAYSTLVPSNSPHGLIVKPSANMKITSYKKPNTLRNVLIGLALLAGFGAWWFYFNYVEKPSPTKLTGNGPATSEVGTESTEPGGALPEVALPAAERAPEPPQVTTELNLPPAATPASPAAGNSATSQAPAVVNSVNNAVVQNSPVPNSPVPNAQLTAATTLSSALPEATQASAQPTPTNMARLEFSANQETWIDVVDAAGKEVYNKTLFAGSRERIDVTPPVNVTVGNAGATSMSMNGKSVELAPHSRNNVAHIKLDK